MVSYQPVRLAVLISGGGTNLQAVLDACESGRLPAKVVVVVSNKASAAGLARAEKAGVTAVVKQKREGQDRKAYDRELASLVAEFKPDWVILAGWMRILSAEFLNTFPSRVVNLHPALPGMFTGTHAIERAYSAYRSGEIEHTGVMVHLVPDEGVDCGPVVGQEQVPIFTEDTLEALEDRIHQTEHRLLVDTLRTIIK
jgi:phosphoribosylglycinamide formyltransferase 1